MECPYRVPAGLLKGLLAVLLTVSCATFAVASGNAVPAPEYIAHAGGGWRGHVYQNTIEALDANHARGFRFFEIDFSWTSDGRLAGVHDWETTYPRLYRDGAGIPDLASFAGRAMVLGTTAITPQRLEAWLATHPEAWIVSDIKNDNLEGLDLIAGKHPRLADRLIPQIYHPDEYSAVNDLGYGQAILTVYRMPDSAFPDLMTLLEKQRLLALTMPEEWLGRRDLVERVSELGVPICVHTINDPAQWQGSKERGASCVYTDFLAPE